MSQIVLTDEEQREHRLEYHRLYHHKNKDKCNERRRQHYLENKDKCKDRRRQYYLENKDKIKERQRLNYHGNKNKCLSPKERYIGEINPPTMTALEKQFLEARIADLKRKHEEAIKQGNRYGILSR